MFSSMAPDSLDDLVSPSEAAARIGAASSTVRSWAARGYLKPTGLDEQHRPLYLMIDVLRTARETRRRAIGARRTA